MSLESIFAETKKIKIGEVSVEIRQISLGDVPAVADVVSIVFSEKDIKKSAIKLIQKDFEKAKDLIVRLTDIPPQSVGKLSIDASIQIVTEILGENITFLTEKVVPQIQGLQQKITGLTKSKG